LRTALQAGCDPVNETTRAKTLVWNERERSAGSVGRRVDTWIGYGPLLVLPALVLGLAPTDWPRWAVMWWLAVGIYAGCKWLTWSQAPAASRPVPLWLHLGYLIAWPGMDAVSFLKQPSTARVPRPSSFEWLFAWSKLLVGFVVLFGITRFVPMTLPYWAGWVGMFGLAFVLHFGAFHLMSCAWRRIGVDAQPLMNWPVRAESLSDYWGQRWNRAFRDLTHRFLFRPLTPRLGARGALFAGFVFSGIVHDLVVSVPAGGLRRADALLFDSRPGIAHGTKRGRSQARAWSRLARLVV
jgi:hypothetical protein